MSFLKRHIEMITSGAGFPLKLCALPRGACSSRRGGRTRHDTCEVIAEAGPLQLGGCARDRVKVWRETADPGSELLPACRCRSCRTFRARDQRQENSKSSLSQSKRSQWSCCEECVLVDAVNGLWCYCRAFIVFSSELQWLHQDGLNSLWDDEGFLCLKTKYVLYMILIHIWVITTCIAWYHYIQSLIDPLMDHQNISHQQPWWSI